MSAGAATPPRVFFDVSYTRGQLGSVGITRTVRRLRDELDGVLPAGSACVPVAFHSRGFREVPPVPAHPASDAPREAGASLAARVIREVPQSWVRRFAVALVPLPLLYQVWKVYSTLAYDGLAAGLAPVQFRPGDRLLMCDASWSYRAWAAVARARRQGARVVVMVHDLIPIRHPEFGSPLFTLMFQRWLHAMLACADAMICNSRATEDDLRAYAAAKGLRLPPTGHFRLGSDPAPGLAAAPVRPELDAFLSGPAPCFAAVGTVEPRKNYGWLLGAFEPLWAAGHEVRLLLVGRPSVDARADLERLTTHPELGRRLLVLFDATDGEIAAVYARARALLFASVAEGFGLPLVEARGRGCPVIAARLPVFEELADGGVFLYPQQDAAALHALVLEHAARDRRAEVGVQAPFRWEDSARDCLATVDRLLAAATEPPLRASPSRARA